MFLVFVDYSVFDWNSKFVTCICADIFPFNLNIDSFVMTGVGNEHSWKLLVHMLKLITSNYYKILLNHKYFLSAIAENKNS